MKKLMDKIIKNIINLSKKKELSKIIQNKMELWIKI